MANITKYVTSKGETRWRVRYRKPGGRQTDKRGFKRKIDAETWAAKNITVAKATGTYVDPQAGRRTMQQLYDQYVAERRPLWKPSSYANVSYAWDHYCAPQWAHWPVRELTTAHIQQWVAGISERTGAATAQRVGGILHDLCAIAVRDLLIPVNPVDGVDLPKRPKRKPRRVYLTAPRLLAFAESAGRSQRLGPERRALILLLGLTGLRWGEAAGLCARDVDLDHGLLHVSRNLVYVGAAWHEGTPKSGQSREVPMPRLVVDALAPIVGEREPDERVFREVHGGPLRKQSIGCKSCWYARSLMRLGWPKEEWPVPHDLRHTAASLAVHAGANVKALQRMLGHSSASLTLDVYADLFTADLDDVARSLDVMVEKECGQNVGKAVGGKGSGVVQPQ